MMPASSTLRCLPGRNLRFVSNISLPLNSYLSTDVRDVPTGGQQEHRGHAGRPGQGPSCHGKGTFLVFSLSPSVSTVYDAKYFFHQANIVRRCGWRISEEGGMIHHQEIFRAGGMTRLDFLIFALSVVGGHYKKHRAHRGGLKQ